MADHSLRCWIGDNNVIMLREDVTPGEVAELHAMVTAAFNAGLRSGYKQGCERTLARLNEEATA